MQFSKKRPLTLETTHSIFLLITLLIGYLYVLPRWADPNQDSRLKMVVAVVEDGTFQIDKYLGTTVDYARVNDHYYSDKAPGVAFLGIPVYILLRPLFETPLVASLEERLQSSPAFQDSLNPEGTGIDRTKIRFALAQVVIAVFAGALPTAVLGVLIFRWLSVFLPSAWPRLLIVLGYGLLTPAYAYANTMYGHQLSAALLFAAFYLVSTSGAKISPPTLLIVGGLLGYSVITEYPTIVMVGILFLYTFYRLYRLEQWKQVVWVLASAAPIALAWMFYNQAVFGGPLNLGYSYSELWVGQHHTGFMSLTMPGAAALWGITFGTFRGLFFLSPWLILCLVGFVLWWQAGKLRAEWAVSLACVLSIFLFNASSIMWWGGFAIGPRYLLPALPFLVLPMAFVLLRWQKERWFQVVFAGLLLWSAVTLWGLTLAGQAFPSDMLRNPLIEYALPQWRAGNIARNMGTLLSLDGWLSLLPLVLLWGFTAAIWAYLAPKISRQIESPPS